jgi:hypothetical protein
MTLEEWEAVHMVLRQLDTDIAELKKIGEDIKAMRESVASIQERLAAGPP